MMYMWSIVLFFLLVDAVLKLLVDDVLLVVVVQ